MANKKIKLLAAAAAVTAVFFGWRQAGIVKTTATAQTLSTEWPQLQHDAQRRGSTVTQVDPPYQATWVWLDKTHIVHNFVSQAGSSITDTVGTFTQTVVFATTMQPIVGQNTVYFGALNGVFYAVDAATGNNKWDFTTGGPIIGTAAYASGIVTVGSMDGRIYGLNASTGAKIWAVSTGAGVNAAPVIHNGTVYAGSRDGYFYAINLTDGTVKWRYLNTVDNSVSSLFNGAPIMSPAAVSEDGTTVFFGAENDFFYALNTATGTVKWSKKVMGQSFQGSWPVVKGNLVIITSESSYGTPENNMQPPLDALPANPTWAQEKDAINTWLAANPRWKLVHVFNVNDGSIPFEPAIGPYSPFGMPFMPPVVDNSSRILWPYWLVKDATFFQATPCYGNNNPLDLSVMDPVTGDRITLPNNQSLKFCPEIDNVFNVTVGGNYIYLQEGFRGAIAINLNTGAITRLSAQIAKWDGGDFRGWGYNVIYYGNDSQPITGAPDPHLPLVYRSTSGLGAGIPAASINGTPMLFINESDVVAIVGITHKP